MDKAKTEREKQDRKLDEALKETFPTSDPVAISEPAPAPRIRPESDDKKKRAP